MKVAIIGANGQLGTDLMLVFAEYQPFALNHEQIEIGNIDSVNSVLSELKPDVVVNTAAFHNVPLCEKEIEKAFQVNGLGALNLAKVTESLGIDFVHVSTDYVFDGTKQAPYIETDATNPLNVYAITKLAGEHFVAAYSPRHYIVRSCGLYGHATCRAKGTNFVETMLKLSKEKNELRVVNDEIITPTYTFHLAEQIRELVKTKAYGIYHATNNGFCSWYEFAKAIFEIAGIEINVIPVSSKEFASPVKRPSYSVLENNALLSLGIDIMPHWKESLQHYFRNQ
ncbi:MAG: dTDP-4-dehydrorhamnose reductase [Ignavibacteriae bacterium]|nr:dTDP-4-dehydrorhamnose reductase [Ignavibacteriota bacterium]